MDLVQEISTFLRAGGGIGTFFMAVILFAWAIGLAIAFEKIFSLSKMYVDGPSLMNEIQKYILTGDLQGAIKVCSGSPAVLAKVLKNALKRANQSMEQIQNAVDATALEVVPKVEKRLSYLQLVANISTLIGLLGTIFGLIESFQAVAAAEDPAQKAQLLSDGISTAMNTTAFGLMSAISIMVIHTVLTNKSEQIIGSVDEFSVKLMDMLHTKKIDSPITPQE
jgi:biopolymer transport protein ExbB